MRNMVAASLYTGIGAIEASNLSVGRGTDSPFEQFGAPWIDGPRLAAELNRRNLPGVRFYPISFTPTSSRFANELCHGVFIIVTDRDRLRPVRVGARSGVGPLPAVSGAVRGRQGRPAVRGRHRPAHPRRARIPRPLPRPGLAPNRSGGCAGSKYLLYR